MFGTGEWSYNRSAGSTTRSDYFAAWDDAYRSSRASCPDARIAGPNTSILYDQVEGLPEAHRGRRHRART